MVKLKEVPFKVQLFKVVATDGDIDWVITNCPDETLTTQAARLCGFDLAGFRASGRGI